MVTITISGTPGSGKTTAAKLLAEKLKLKYVYVGDIFREMAEKHRMSLEEFGRYCEKHKEIDQQLDDHQLEILIKGNVIVEGRISGWLAYRNNIPAVKVLIDTDIETRVKRILKREGGDFSERKKEMLTREKSEATRYKKYYNIDLKDKSIYDIVIDSGDKTPAEIVDIIVKKIDG
ncbi:MAG: cytidylate kinase family protein [Candidatus Thermoplasmatota archaeon]|jgi:predicted cytidylate kinase|nr:cytidylate kinase family protein [Candidatus Thermoplasmatota archaeon]